jgi:hypothetical protein
MDISEKSPFFYNSCRIFTQTGKNVFNCYTKIKAKDVLEEIEEVLKLTKN